jgi:hypothetical protein
LAKDVLPLPEQPAQALKEAKNVIVYNDYIGNDI